MIPWRSGTRYPWAFSSAQEGFDTATPIGRLLLNLLASLAEFELDTISERVRAGMVRAKEEGKRFGNRPIETNAKKWQAAQAAVRAVETRQLSYRQAAKQYGVSVSTIQRTQVKLKQRAPV